MPDREDFKKHTQSADHTVYSQNFPKQTKIMGDKHNVTNYTHVSNYEKQGTTTQNVGSKMWLPGFNMTASSIKSEQSVRVMKDHINHTPIQHTNKMSESRRPDRTLQGTENSKMNYTPEVHQNKPRTFGNANNPSLTAHSMNVASTNMGSTGNHITRSPISQAESYNEMYSNNKFSSDNIGLADNTKGPIKPMNYTGMSAHTSLKTEMLPSPMDNLEDDNVSESRHHRYSQHSNKR